MRQRLTGLLLGLVLALAGCDMGPGFETEQPDTPAGDPPTQEAVDDGEAEAPAESEPADEASDPASGDGSEPAPEASEGDGGDGGEAATGGATADVLAAGGLFVPPTQAEDWVAANAGDPRAQVIEDRIASVPSSIWLTGGDGVGEVVDTAVSAAAAENTVPVLVAYNVPGRDCGQYSAGGADGSDAYRAWVDEFVAGIGDRPAIVILEPDALAGMDCLTDDLQQDRLDLLSYASEQFAAQAPNAWTYLDAGHADWQPADVMAERLQAAGIASARGFALNVSNYVTTADNDAYGADVNAALGTAVPFVVDTSRNGNGSNGEWCNPEGRALGAEPSIHELGSGLEMELWIKLPGESDGDCGIGAGTTAGQFVPDIAVALAEG